MEMILQARLKLHLHLQNLRNNMDNSQTNQRELPIPSKLTPPPHPEKK